MRPWRGSILRAMALGLAASVCGARFAVGCIGDTGAPAHPSAESYGSVSELDAGYADAAPVDDADAALSCTPRAPSPGAPCSSEGAVCEYGVRSVPQCDTLASCTRGQWQVTLPDAGNVLCAPARPDLCPADLSDVPVGATCAPANLDCDYAKGRCECAQNLPRTPGWPAVWKCPDPASTTNLCPSPRARLGTPCYQESQRCDYGACQLQGGTLEECRGKVWIEQPVDCFCPAALPKERTACSRDSLACEYGSTNLASCNTVATCYFGQWVWARPKTGAPCVSAPASACPDAGPSIQGTTCTEGGLDCDYGGIRCECNNGPTMQSETTWRCDEPALAGPGCGPRPLLGTACPEQGLRCDYGSCEIRGGSGFVCSDVWSQSGGACSSNGPGPPQFLCPPEPPLAGAPCFPTNAPISCEYGSGALVTCDTVANCNGVPGLGWVVTTPALGDPSCTSASPDQCPGSFAAVPRGTDCTGPSSPCDYPEGRCLCSSPPGSSKPVWSCQDPPAGCPRPRPRLGIPCVQEGLVCPYDPCGPQGGQTEVCLGGAWSALAVDCAADAGF